MDILRADPTHEPQILALATRTLGWDDDPRFAELYRWKHDRNPFGTSPRWVAVEDGEVIGFRVLMRWRFRTPAGETVEAVRAVDTATDPAHQGKGIFKALTLGALDEVRAEGVELVFNTPNDQSRPGYLKMGWTELGRPPVAVVPRLSSLPRIARSRTPAQLWSVPTDAGEPAGEWFADAANAEVVRGLLADAATDRWRTDRTPEVLAWRYGLEELHYRVLTADHLPGRPAGPGLAVLRVRRRGPSVEATVVEVLTRDPRLRRRLLRAALSATGADYALVAASARVDATPALSLATFSPLVTWRTLGDLPKPELGAVAFTLGDLELF
jgi:GNAT superfamily N-acetyltransferase